MDGRIPPQTRTRGTSPMSKCSRTLYYLTGMTTFQVFSCIKRQILGPRVTFTPPPFSQFYTCLATTARICS